MDSPTSLPPPSVHQALDPRTLGRPIHLLSAFAKRFGGELSDFLRVGLNRRYGTQFELNDVQMVCMHEPQQGLRWRVYGSSTGLIGLSLERSLVLRVLHCRYGLRDSPETNLAGEPVTTTEERLGQKLGQQLVTTLVSRIREGLQLIGAAPDQSATDTISWLGESEAAVGNWMITARIHEPQIGLLADLRFSLDEAWMRELLSQLAAGRSAPKVPLKDETQPLVSQLKVRLVAQLLNQKMALGDVLDIRVGDVLPISLHATEVLVRDSRLFTATVAEHKGKLWLTAFNDIK
jgi:flagellar motor switch protein FliM